MPIVGIVVAMAALAGAGKTSASKEGRFSATWPGEPKEKTRKVETPRGGAFFRSFRPAPGR